MSGVLVPLFSLRSRDDFGIGDFGCVEGLFAWMQQAQQRMWMLLPMLPTSLGNTSPYSTCSAFGLDGMYIDIASLPEFEEAGGFDGLSQEEKRQLEEARRSPTIRYDLVFPLKRSVLWRCFQVFLKRHFVPKDARRTEFLAYVEAEKRWLEDFSLYAAISQSEGHKAWWQWPEGLRDRHPSALAEVKERLSEQILYQQWVQWTAEREWEKVRALAKKRGVFLCGDEPFIIGEDSADVWAHRHLLRRDARLGVPPDDFSATGQDWGLPWFDFPAMEKDDYQWLRFRAKKSASYFDVRRVDHAVGYFRQYIRDEKTPTGRFVPDAEPLQQALGERHFRMLSEPAGVIAEDLGVIPDFVRHTLTNLGLPGYWVMRWSRYDGVYVAPSAYPVKSLATTGTHDTEPVSVFWESVSPWEREAMARAYPELQKVQPLPSEFTPPVHQALVKSCLNSNSRLCILPWQDILGTRDRINLPGTIEGNWVYKIAQPTEDLLSHSETQRAAETLAEWTRHSGR